VEVTLEDRSTLTVDGGLVGSLDKEEELPQLQEAEIVGNLHLIDWDERPRFKIRTPDADLSFELTPELRSVIDELRWKMVRATAHWEVGTNRARLIDGPYETRQLAGVELRAIIGAPDWVVQQLRRLESFTSSQHGWDGAGARAPLRPRINASMQLLRDVHRLYPGLISGQGAVFGLFEDGAVELEWTSGSRFLNAEPVRGGWDLLCTEAGDVVVERQVDYRTLLVWVGWLLGLAAPGGA
jgi:hypothetical protein